LGNWNRIAADADLLQGMVQMSRTTKIEKARVIHSRKIKRDARGNFVSEVVKPHKDVKLTAAPRVIEGRLQGPYVDDGGVRYGNNRKMWATQKVKERRAERKKNKRGDD
jgi:hypothetical protein